MSLRHLYKVGYIHQCDSLRWGIFVNVMVDNYSMCHDLDLIFSDNHSLKFSLMYTLKTIGLNDNSHSVNYLMHNRMIKMIINKI